MLGILRLAEPLIRDPHAAGERDIAIDDERLAVGAVIGFFERPELQRVEPRQLDAGLLQPFLVVAAEHRSDRIENHAHDHPAPGGLFKRGDELVADAAFLEHVGLEGDSPFGLLNGGEHRWKRIAIAQHDVGVARFHGGADQRRHVVRETGIGSVDRTLDAQRVLILREQQQAYKDRDADGNAKRPLATMPARLNHAWLRCKFRSGVCYSLFVIRYFATSVPSNVRLNGALATPTGVTSPRMVLPATVPLTSKVKAAFGPKRASIRNSNASPFHVMLVIGMRLI